MVSSFLPWLAKERFDPTGIVVPMANPYRSDLPSSPFQERPSFGSLMFPLFL